MGDPAVTALERRLRGIGDELAFPPTPRLASSVPARLLTERAAMRTRRPFPGIALWTRRRTLVAAVIGLLLIGGAAVAGRLAIGAVGVRIVSGTPTTGPTSTEASLGRAVPLERAAELAGFDPRYPPSLGEPDDVRVALTWGAARVVVLGWRADRSGEAIPGLPWSSVLMELPGEDELALKQVLTGDALVPTSVDGEEALWLAEPHELLLRTPDGGEQRLSVRGHTLVWQHDGITYRLETLLGKGDARALAETTP
jgi:hypothetical protein